MVLGLSMTYWSVAMASPLAEARKSYIRGDLSATVKILESNLYTRPTFQGKEVSEALGLYGISQFTLGNKVKAEKAFHDLLRQNPGSVLDKRYILDPAIEPFFERLKGTYSQKPKGILPQRSAGGRSKPTPPPETTQKTPQAPRPERVKSPSNGIEVTSNAPRTTVFADGIFIGTAGQRISMEPGSYQLTISAEGYLTRETRIRVLSGKFTTLDVKLAKPKPPKPPQKSSSNQNEVKASSKTTNPKKGGAEQRQKTSMNFNQELTEERVAAKRSRPRRSLSDEFFREQAPPPAPSYAPPPAPSYSAPSYPTPVYPQPYQPPPVYQAPQMYPQPSYSVPMYQQPYPAVPYQQPAPLPPSYSYPQPDPYAAPNYQPIPPTSEYGAPNPYEEEFEAGDSSASYDSYSKSQQGYSGPGGNRRRARNSRHPALAILPLGIGQFQNGDYTKGTLFLLGEGGLLGYGLFVKYKTIPDAVKKFDIDRQTEIDEKVKAEDIDAKEIERVKYITDYNDLANYCLIGAGALYVVGVVDAYSNLNSKPSRQRADLERAEPEKKYSFKIQPRLDGGMHLKFSLLLK